ncbi:hypothetical protein AADZ91_16390 [Colwelliaceae bacterium 6441]
MHINSDRLIESLTKVELMHIESCTHCANERQKLMALRVSANQFDVVQPPEQAWQVIRTKYPVQTKKKHNIRQFIYSSAASIIFVAVGWLIWNSYSLQNQLEQVLMVNHNLEQQLSQIELITYQQSQLLLQVRKVEAQLVNDISLNKKVVLLKQRRLLMTEMLNKKEQKYDHSI